VHGIGKELLQTVKASWSTLADEADSTSFLQLKVGVMTTVDPERAVESWVMTNDAAHKKMYTEREVAQNIRQIPVEAGWYDPHMHETGALNYHGSLMLVAKATALPEMFEIAKSMNLVDDDGSGVDDVEKNKKKIEKFWNTFAPDFYSFLARDVLGMAKEGHGNGKKWEEEKKLLKEAAAESGELPHQSSSELDAVDRVVVDIDSGVKTTQQWIQKFKNVLYKSGRQAIIDNVYWKEDNRYTYNPQKPSPLGKLLMRTPTGSGTALPLIKCLKLLGKKETGNWELGKDSPQTTLDQTRNILTRLFTANPMMDFNQAYGGRSLIVPKREAEMFSKFIVREAIDSDTSYSQISTPITKIPNFEGGVRKAEASVYATRGLNLPNVHLGWMPMFVGTILACAEDEKVQVQGVDAEGKLFSGPSGQSCTEDEWLTGVMGLKPFKTQLELQHVDGVDFASPETYVHNTGKGRERLQLIVDAMEKAATEQTTAAKEKHMMVHIHTGEGFPIYDKATIFKNSNKKQQIPYDNTELTAGAGGTDKAKIIKTMLAADAKNFGMTDEYFKKFCTEAKKNILFQSTGVPVVKQKHGTNFAEVCPEKRYPSEAELKKMDEVFESELTSKKNSFARGPGYILENRRDELLGALDRRDIGSRVAKTTWSRSRTFFPRGDFTVLRERASSLRDCTPEHRQSVGKHRYDQRGDYHQTPQVPDRTRNSYNIEASIGDAEDRCLR